MTDPMVIVIEITYDDLEDDEDIGEDNTSDDGGHFEETGVLRNYTTSDYTESVEETVEGKSNTSYDGVQEVGESSSDFIEDDEDVGEDTTSYDRGNTGVFF